MELKFNQYRRGPSIIRRIIDIVLVTRIDNYFVVYENDQTIKEVELMLVTDLNGYRYRREFICYFLINPDGFIRLKSISDSPGIKAFEIYNSKAFLLTLIDRDI